jgi:hypothetical protein
VNPRIRLDPRLWTLTEVYGPQRPSGHRLEIETLKLQNLSRLPEFVRAPERHLDEVRHAYHGALADCDKLEQVPSSLPTTVMHDGNSLANSGASRPIRKLHSLYQLGFAMVLCTAIILNSILRASSTNAHDTCLLDELGSLIDKVTAVASQALPYRPIGSSPMPTILMVPWAVTDDVVQRVEIERVLRSYQDDFLSTRWLNMALEMREKLRLPRWYCVYEEAYEAAVLKSSSLSSVDLMSSMDYQDSITESP